MIICHVGSGRTSPFPRCYSTYQSIDKRRIPPATSVLSLHTQYVRPRRSQMTPTVVRRQSKRRCAYGFSLSKLSDCASFQRSTISLSCLRPRSLVCNDRKVSTYCGEDTRGWTSLKYVHKLALHRSHAAPGTWTCLLPTCAFLQKKQTCLFLAVATAFSFPTSSHGKTKCPLSHSVVQCPLKQAYNHVNMLRDHSCFNGFTSA